MNVADSLTMMSETAEATGKNELPYASPAVMEGRDRLSNLLSENELAPVTGADPMLSLPTVAKPTGGAMGEMLVAKLDAVGAEFKANMVRAHVEMEKAPDQLSLRDILKLEYEFAVITLQIDVVGKGVQKAVQNMDTLVKMQ